MADAVSAFGLYIKYIVVVDGESVECTQGDWWACLSTDVHARKKAASSINCLKAWETRNFLLVASSHVLIVNLTTISVQCRIVDLRVDPYENRPDLENAETSCEARELADRAEVSSKASDGNEYVWEYEVSPGLV